MIIFQVDQNGISLIWRKKSEFTILRRWIKMFLSWTPYKIEANMRKISSASQNGSKCRFRRSWYLFCRKGSISKFSKVWTPLQPDLIHFWCYLSGNETLNLIFWTSIWSKSKFSKSWKYFLNVCSAWSTSITSESK